MLLCFPLLYIYSCPILNIFKLSSNILSDQTKPKYYKMGLCINKLNKHTYYQVETAILEGPAMLCCFEGQSTFSPIMTLKIFILGFETNPFEKTTVKGRKVAINRKICSYAICIINVKMFLFRSRNLSRPEPGFFSWSRSRLNLQTLTALNQAFEPKKRINLR